MESFLERFCAAHRCREDEFVEKVFWQCIYPHAIGLVPFLGGWRSEHFSADRDLIAGAGSATRMEQVREEVRDFIMSRDNRGALRQHLRIRVSAKRLLRLAGPLLSASGGVPPSAATRVEPEANVRRQGNSRDPLPDNFGAG